MRSAAAYTIIEMLVYISVLAVLLGVGYAALYRCMDSSTGLRRNADDIANALHAGESWRADMRAAGARVRLETNANVQILQLPGAHKQISYCITTNGVFRRMGSGGWSPVIANVKSSAFIADPRPSVIAWRWELELQPRKKALSRIPPLFTFIAVPVGDPAK